jgi:hypothetical protein
MRSPRTPLAEASPEVPAHLAAVVDRCLALDPAARPVNARALREALERALARDRITPCREELACAVWTATKDLPAPQPTARIRRSRAAYVTVSALAVPSAIRPRAIAAVG